MNSESSSSSVDGASMEHVAVESESVQGEGVECASAIRVMCRPKRCRQLAHDLYAFCRNYQNASCFYPRCKYIHATVFEQDFFYRTGLLPPHALAHMKELIAPRPRRVQQTEDPGSHLHRSPAAPHPAAIPFPNSPPVAAPHPPSTSRGGWSGGGADTRLAGETRSQLGAAAASTPSRKRKQTGNDDCPPASNPGRPDTPASAAANNCDFNEFRQQCQKELEIMKMQTALLQALPIAGSPSFSNPGSGNTVINVNCQETGLKDILSMVFSSTNGRRSSDASSFAAPPQPQHTIATSMHPFTCPPPPPPPSI